MSGLSEWVKNRTPFCSNCNIRNVHLSKKSETTYWCRPCANKYRRRWYKTAKGRALRLKHSTKNHALTKIYGKDYARNKVKVAIRNGTLVRPDKCSNCFKRRKPQAHHPDYSKPLDIVWLCTGCHADEHVRIRELDRQAGR